MATFQPDPSQIPDLTNQLNDLGGQIKSVKDSLTSSGAYGGQTPDPTYLTSQQTQLNNLQKRYDTLNDSIITAKWYPQTTTSVPDDTVTDPGLIGKALDALAVPERAVVGGVQHVLGQGTTGSLFGDMYDNAFNNKKGMAYVYQQLGAPKGVSMVAGLISDIALDPVNILMMGSGTLLGAMGKGALKVGAEKVAEEGLVAGAKGVGEGLALGVTSNLARKAAILSRVIHPFVSPEATKTIGAYAAQKAEEYNVATGQGLEYFLQPNKWDQSRAYLGNKVAALAERNPKLQTFLAGVGYHPARAEEMQRVLGVVKTDYGPQLEGLKGEGEYIPGKRISQATADNVSYFNGKAPLIGQIMTDPKAIKAMQDTLYNMKVAKTPGEAVTKLAEELDQVYGRTLHPEQYIVKNGQEVNTEMLMEVANKAAQERNITLVKDEFLNYIKDVDRIPFGGTNVDRYDNMMKNFYQYRAIPVNWGKDGEQRMLINGNTILNAYKNMTELFKFSKISLSPGTDVNNILSNVVFQHFIGGFGTHYPDDAGLIQALYNGKAGSMEAFKDLIANAPGGADNLRYIEGEGAPVMRLSSGGQMKGRLTKKGQSMLGSTRRLLIKSGGLENLPEEQVEAITKNALRDFYNSLPEKEKSKYAAQELFGFTDPTERGGMSIAQKATETGYASYADMPMSLQSALYSPTSPVAKWRKGVAEEYVKAGLTPSTGLKAKNLFANKMANFFERVDQQFKMNSFVQSVVRGYDTSTIAKINRYLPLQSEDLVPFIDKQTNVKMYALKPEKAMQLAQVQFMNYAMMPSFVRVARNFPLLNSPFSQFVFANAVKTGQAFVRNPESFNKITFAMNDLGGTKTPFEKSAIYDPTSSGYQYYSYLGQPGMFRIPGFDDTPLYANMAQALPYMSINMLQPETTQYDKSGLPESVMQLLNRSTIMGDPAGQLIKNYIIQPLLLQDELQMRGSFGQAITPIGATLPEKVGYSVRDLAEGYVPGGAGFLGGTAANIAGVDPTLLPLYQARRTAEAWQGKNPLGKTTKESTSSKVIRAALAQIAMPIQSPMDTTYNKP
jgi:hypothetical protein